MSLFFLVLVVSTSSVRALTPGNGTRSSLEDTKIRMGSYTNTKNVELKVPQGFLLGVGSSAYQVEGGWDADGKGENSFDRHARVKPNWNEDSTNGDVACDSYHQYKEDVKLLKELNVDFYRFSVSWSRVLPTGDPSNVNQKGLDYYNDLIDELLLNGIVPMLTIFHWDTPQKLQDIGGWTNPLIVPYFTQYADLLFRTYGDRVKYWYTLNEPQLFGVNGHGRWHPAFPDLAPSLDLKGVGEYLAVHHMLLAHAAAFHLYQTNYKHQDGKIGLALNLWWHVAETDSFEDNEAQRRARIYEIDWVMRPLFCGDYPSELREMVDKASKLEGRAWSRLPVFTPEESSLLKGSYDFIGINHYTGGPVRHEESHTTPSIASDLKILPKMFEDKKKFGAVWLSFYPEGFGEALRWFASEYNNPPVLISENGCDVTKGIEDTERVIYHKSYLKEMLNAMEDGCNIFGYTVWSLMDSFEWGSGYQAKFGIYHVDFNDPKRKRSPKKSLKFFKTLFHDRLFLEDTPEIIGH